MQPATMPITGPQRRSTAAAAQAEAGDHSQGDQGGERGGHRLLLRRSVQQGEYHGGEGDGQDHCDDAAHHGRYDAPEDDHPPGNDELDDRGEAITRLTRVPGPPSTTAVMQKGMETAAVNMGRRAPAPTGPRPRACTSVEIPTTTREANTIQSR